MTEQYQPPTITVVGTVESLTAGSSTGKKLDRNYPQGTPAVNIFS